MFKYSITVLILMCAGMCKLAAQNELSIQLIMTPNPTPYISDWRNETNTARLIVTNNNPENVRARVRTIISRLGERVAATRDAQMDVITFEPGTTTLDPVEIFPVENVQFFGDVDNQVLRSGQIPGGAYEICVDLLEENLSRTLTQNEVCRPFRIIKFQAPLLVLPANGAQINPVRERRPIFRWTPVVPAPPDGPASVRYVLQVFEILPGQRAVQAFRANQPVLNTETQGITSTPWPPDVELPAPGQSYVWNVRALDLEDNPLGEPDGYAEPFTFVMLEVVAPDGMSDSQEFGGDVADGGFTGQLADGGNKGDSPLTISGAQSLADSKRDRTTMVFTPMFAFFGPSADSPSRDANIIAFDRNTDFTEDVQFWRLPLEDERDGHAKSLARDGELISQRMDSIQTLIPDFYDAVRVDSSRTHAKIPFPSVTALKELLNVEYMVESIRIQQTAALSLTALDDPTGRLGGMQFQFEVNTPDRLTHDDPWRLLAANLGSTIRNGYFKPRAGNLLLFKQAKDAKGIDPNSVLAQADVGAPIVLQSWQGWTRDADLFDLAREAGRNFLASICLRLPDLDTMQSSRLATIVRRLETTRMDSSNRELVMDRFYLDAAAVLESEVLNDSQADLIKADIDWYADYMGLLLPAISDPSIVITHAANVPVLLSFPPLKDRCINPWRRPDIETFDDYDILESGFTVGRTSLEAPILRRRENQSRVGMLWFDEGETTARLVKQLDSLNTARGESLALYDPENKDGMVLGSLLQARAFGPDGPVLLVTSHCALDPLPDVDPALMTCKLETVDVELNRKNNSMTVTQLLRMPNGETWEMLLSGAASGTFVARLPACSGADCIITFTNAAGE